MENNLYSFDTQSTLPDTSETIHISPLALLKMMKHGRSGIPLEVMGLMLGEFIDDYNVKVIDVFAMPQSGTGVTVEAVDPVFQTKMMDILKLTGRSETVVGWYHSHPGFGCWLSSTDVSTQSSFEQICKRAVAVVVDPIQSVKGNVVIDAFRNISQITMGDPRITTSCIGALKKPTFVSLVHGLNKSYYALNITFAKDMCETKMLSSLNRRDWTDNLIPAPLEACNINVEKYLKMIEEEYKSLTEDGDKRRIGEIDHRKHLLRKGNEIIAEDVINNLLLGIHQYIFQ